MTGSPKARTAAQEFAEFLTSTGQLLTFAQSGKRPDDGNWNASGDPFECSLYGPKGNEIPAPLSLLNLEFYWLAWGGETTVRAKNRIQVGLNVYHVHTDEADRSNALLPRVLVSRLGPYLDASTGYPAVYTPTY